MNKPKLSPEEIVFKIKEEKGITFNYISEEEAIKFLKDKNNYYRLASYRKNYDKKLNGVNTGKYIDLDFACLVDLSTIDMHLRFLIMKMCLDVEHDLKVSLLNDISQDTNEDGYSIVTKFIEDNNYLKEEIYNKRNTTYVGDLISKFFVFDAHKSANGNTVFDHTDINCPIWAFVEIISFGTFIKLYSYYYGLDTPIPVSFLHPIKSIRNACAHNNCLINNLRSGLTRPGKSVMEYISKIDTISKDVRKKYLSVRPIFEFVNLLIVYDKIVSSDVKNYRLNELHDLVDIRMKKHADYYKSQQLLCSSYSFVKKIVDFLQ